MPIDPRHLAPCGLYCGVCAVLYASLDDNRKFKELLVGVYKGKLPDSDNLAVEDIYCEGCLSENPFGFCRKCGIKDCARQKGIQGCHQCADFPCSLIESFPMPVGKRVMLRTIPYWKEHGTEVFVRDEEARYVCPGCGNQLFRGARRCNRCKTAVDLD
jgi:predicted RNA-binding Zn-ribbon protein involved in translation (DUF1610 family)